MFFKDFPSFLYDFNYGDDIIKTDVVKDITRNIRVKRDILANVSLFDHYDIIDGETPEIISEKFYGTPEYHWVIMLANEKFDWLSDYPLMESELQKHISHVYNPAMYSDDWYWKRDMTTGKLFVYIRVTYGSGVPFDPDYLNAPMTVTLSDPTKRFVKVINFPSEDIGLDLLTQYFSFEYTEEGKFGPVEQFGTGDANYGTGQIRIHIETTGRENNPVYYIDPKGFKVNPTTSGAIPITGAENHRRENDMKRRIKIIAPSLLELLIKNYEEIL
jgi:hypothetical protein